MPNTYVPTPAILVDVTEPVDTEPRTVASVTQMTREIADGVMYNNQQLTALADIAALRAIDTTSLANSAVRLVKGQGFYTLDTGSSATEIEPWIIDPTTGPGRWISSTAHQVVQTRFVPCARALVGMPTAANAPSITSSWRPLPQASSVVFDGPGFIVQVASTHATNAWGFLLELDDWMIDGATLSSVTLRYEPSNVGANPTVFPQMSIFRDSRLGSTGAKDQLNSGGFVIDSGGTYEFGTVRNFVYTPDQVNVINLGSYSYQAAIYDEHGTNAVVGNNIIGMFLSFTAIPDARRS